MTEKIKRILKDRKGTSFPLVIAVTLALILLFAVSVSISGSRSLQPG